MRVIRVLPNLHVDDLESAKEFYADFLGLSDELMNLGWVARYASPDGAGQVQLVTRDQTSPEDSTISVMTPDVDEAYADALRRGYEIVHPLTTEEWGVHRFLVRAPGGTIVNVVGHSD